MGEIHELSKKALNFKCNERANRTKTSRDQFTFEKHQVISFALFSSAARSQMHVYSDFDFLVQFSTEIDVLNYADNYFSLLEKLEELLVRKVHLVSIKSLKNPVLIEEINRSKVELYAA